MENSQRKNKKRKVMEVVGCYYEFNKSQHFKDIFVLYLVRIKLIICIHCKTSVMY